MSWFDIDEPTSRSPELDELYAEPLALYLNRVRGFDVPRGIFEKGDWLPSRTAGERMPCCDVVAGVESQPWHMFRHCCSARHVGMLTGLKDLELLEFVDYAERVERMEFKQRKLYERE